MKLDRLIDEAQRPSPWRVGNETLYQLCRTRPSHKDVADVVAKIWLIGRSYSAAIERRRNKTGMNDNFYVNIVAPQLIASSIDTWIGRASSDEVSQEERWSIMLEVHHNTTQLFSQISGLEKRSLASKYLHFHVPEVFYIYDTRAVEAMRKLGSVVGRASKTCGVMDNEYRKFVEKCRLLKEHIASEYNVKLSHRELDNLLLSL
jgi:hypothetical protein